MTTPKKIDIEYSENTRIALLEQSIGHINDLLIRIEKRFDNLDNKLDDRFAKIDTKFEKIDAKFDRLNWMIIGVMSTFIASIIFPILKAKLFLS